MSPKAKNIIYWILTGFVAFIFIASATAKLTGNAEMLKMAEKFGLDANTYAILGGVELVSVLLFIYPRTGILGSLLLIAYMGGAIATHLEHGESIIAPCIIQAFIWVVAVLRFPELKSRIFSKK
jgi:uncharacterized membrane protein YphA (DoxX/SURF4 family)